jgi:hypothetical protein
MSNCDERLPHAERPHEALQADAQDIIQMPIISLTEQQQKKARLTRDVQM